MVSAYTSIVEKTPVDTGRARGNWNISIGADDTEVKENQTTPQYQNEKDFPKVKGDESIFISNNLPYIKKLEFGSSKQAPQGMVGVTMAGIKNKIDKIVKDEEKS